MVKKKKKKKKNENPQKKNAKGISRRRHRIEGGGREYSELAHLRASARKRAQFCRAVYVLLSPFHLSLPLSPEQQRKGSLSLPPSRACREDPAVGNTGSRQSLREEEPELPMEAEDYTAWSTRRNNPCWGECGFRSGGGGSNLRCGSKIYPDPDAEVAIMGSMVYCIHYKEGCKWSDELRKLQGHLNMCKFDAIPCTNHCGAMIPRLLMEDHLLYTCPKRRTRCEYCARDFTGETLESHVGSCQLEPIYCENKCGSKIQRRHQSNHRLHECTKRLVPCRYCQKEFVYDTLQIHTSKCPRLPVTCPNRCDVLKIAKEDLESHLNEHCPALTLSCAFKDMGCKFKGSRSAMDQHLDDASKAHLVLVCGVVSRQQHQITSLRAALQGLTLNTSGTLLWRISDYTRRLSEAREGYELCSTPFYTSQHGYKLMATLFLNGNGAGEGTHLSIYIKLLPGEYDALLPWPFSHTVTFVLYDQAPAGETACNIIESFVPDPTWKNFQRPSKEPDALGFGFPRFVSHDALKKRHYIKDDVMFIKVKVDSSKIIAV